MKNIIKFSIAGLVSVPFIAFAAEVFSILTVINKILATVIPILITLAVVYFIWGVIQYTVSTDEEAKKGARSKIIQGLIGLFIIISFWGIIRVVTNTFGVGPEQINRSAIPCIPGPGVIC